MSKDDKNEFNDQEIENMTLDAASLALTFDSFYEAMASNQGPSRTKRPSSVLAAAMFLVMRTQDVERNQGLKITWQETAQRAVGTAIKIAEAALVTDPSVDPLLVLREVLASDNPGGEPGKSSN